jgi:leucyl-tRNA synthetase
MNELGLVGFREPFGRLFHQGWVQQGGSKMSKSKGNVTGPDALLEAYGADALRLYILFVGPADQDIEWSEAGLEGMSRFVRRLWRTVLEVTDGHTASSQAAPGTESQTALRRKAHETIARVTDDIDRRFQFNTPIAAVMELVNEINRAPDDPAARFAAETAVSLIQPYAPHVAAELWERLGHESRMWEEPWPQADPAQLERETFELVVQVNGKVRDRLEVPRTLSKPELIERALASPRVQAHLDGKRIQQTIPVPGKLVNIVTAD